MMHRGVRQRGITFIGLLFVLVVLGFVAYIVMKLVPVYIESFKIDTAMNSVVQEPGIGGMTTKEIGRLFTKRLDIDSVTRITELNYRDYVTITNNQGRVGIDVSYRAETPLFGNVSVVVDFDKHAENY